MRNTNGIGLPRKFPYKYETNREAIIGMISECLVDYIDTSDTNLDKFFCNSDGCPAADKDAAKDEECRGCIRRFLDAPFTGEFTLQKGSFVPSYGSVK